MKKAYIVSLNPNERQFIEPSFSGGNSDYNRDDIVDGMPIKCMTLQGYFQLHKAAPLDFIESAPNTTVINSVRDLDLDFGIGINGAMGLVSAQFAEIVEKLEPNANQFIHLKYTITPDGSHHEKLYCLLNITSVINAINIEKSDVELREIYMAPIFGEPGRVLRTIKSVNPFRIVLKHDIVEGRHLWRGTKSDINSVFISDKLKSILDDTGLKYLDYKMVDVA